MKNDSAVFDKVVGLGRGLVVVLSVIAFDVAIIALVVFVVASILRAVFK